MTNRNLEIFAAAAQCGSMSGAARELKISQSSVSQAIAEIEKEYGVRLFERLSRSLYLTDTGRQLLEYAGRVLQLQEEMDSFLNGASERGSLRIGATVTVGSCVLGPLLRRLKDSAPQVRTEILVANTRALEEKILCSRLDVGLVEGRVEHPDLTVVPVMRDRMVLLCAPGWIAGERDTVSPEELHELPFILREQGSGTRAQLEQAMGARGVCLRVAGECCCAEAIVGCISEGAGVSVMSRRLVERQLNQGILKAYDIEGVRLERTFDLVWHKDKKMTPAMELFSGICRQFEAQEA